MKKLFGILITLFIVLGTNAFAQESITVSAPNAPSYVQNQADAFFEVEFNTNKTAEYKIEYSFDEFATTSSKICYVKAHQRMKQQIPMTNLKKGIHKISVKISCGEELVKECEIETSIIEFYQSQWLDDYTKIGMSTQKSNTEPVVMSYAGVRSGRTNKNWSSSESQEGMFDFSKYRNWSDLCKDLGINIFSGVSYGNTLYIKDSTWKAAPREKEHIDAFARYAVEYLKAHPEITKLEIWNEPNLKSFWPTGPNVNEYVALVKNVSKAIKEYNPDIVIIGGVIASPSGDIFFRDMMAADCLPYIDGMSFHPYIYPSNPDVKFVSNAMKFDNVLEESGDWVDKYISEIGWPTHIGASGVEEEKQAVYLTKTYVYNDYMGYEIAHWYNFRDTGTNPTYNEENFGLVHNDYTPKPGYIALAQLCKRLNASRYIGKYSPVEGLDAYVYTTNNEPFAIMWAKEGSVTYNLGGKSVLVEDIYGNPVEHDGKVEIGEDPYYIFGIDENMAAKAASGMLCEDLAKYKEKWQDVLDLSLLSGLEEKISFNKNIGESGAYSILDQIFYTGKKILDWNKDFDKATFEQTMTMLYQLYEINNKYMNYCAYQTENKGTVTANKVISEVTAKINKLKNYDDTSVLNFSEAMLRFSNRNLKKAQDISQRSYNPAQGGLVRAYNNMASGLCRWITKVSEVEAINKGYSVLTYVFPGKIETAQGRSNEIEMTIENDSNEKIDGELVVYDENDKAVGEPIPVEIESKETGVYKIPIYISTEVLAGEKNYVVKLICDDKVLKKHVVPVTVVTEVEVKLLPTSNTVKDYKKAEFVVTTSLDDVSGSLEVVPPEGWSLAQTKKNFELLPDEELKLEFDVTSIKAVPFNEYTFRIIVRNKDGIVIDDRMVPLDFLRVVRSSEEINTEDFDGSLESWSNAYPIHIATPADANLKESWTNSTIAARAFLKWDEKHLYVLADVYDDYHMQVFGDYDMWRGDSIQLSVDTLGDGGTIYGSDDYEIGFAFNGDGNIAYGFTAANGKIGAYSGTLVSVKRDSEKKLTRYLIKLSDEDISPMKFEQGYAFGFNIAINDADMLDRERYVQFTKGTADKKYPSWYEKFILSPYEAGTGSSQTDAFDINMDNELIITNAG